MPVPERLRVGVRPPVGNYQRVRFVDHGPTEAHMDEEIVAYVREDVTAARLDEVEAERDRYRAWLERLRDAVEREAGSGSLLSPRALLGIIETALGAESKAP